MSTVIDEIVVERLRGFDDLAEIRRLRADVWLAAGYSQSRQRLEALSADPHDEHAIHWVVRQNGQIVAAARLCLHDELRKIPDFDIFPKNRGVRKSQDFPLACFNRLVVHPSAQRQGIARKLDDCRFAEAIRLGAGAVISRPANSLRVKMLSQKGFVSLGRSRQIPGMFQPDSFWHLLPLRPKTTRNHK